MQDAYSFGRVILQPWGTPATVAEADIPFQNDRYETRETLEQRPSAGLNITTSTFRFGTIYDILLDANSAE